MEDVAARRDHVHAAGEDARDAADGGSRVAAAVAAVLAGADDGDLEDLPADGAVDDVDVGPLPVLPTTTSTILTIPAVFILAHPDGRGRASRNRGRGHEPDGQAAGLEVVLAQDGVVLPGLGHPAAGDAVAGAEDGLGGEGPDLEPEPGGEGGEGGPVGLREGEVVAQEVEVGNGQQPQDRLAHDERPRQRLPAVAVHVAVELRRPEREVGEGEKVEVRRAHAGAPARRCEAEE